MESRPDLVTSLTIIFSSNFTDEVPVSNSLYKIFLFIINRLHDIHGFVS